MAGASTVHAQLLPSNVPEIAAAIVDCAAAAKADGVAEEQLATAGWSRAAMSSGDKPIEAELRVYGKAKGNSIITTDADGKKPGTICVVIARLNNAKDYQNVLNAIDALEGTSAVQQEKLTITFMNGKHIIQSDLTGSRDKPSVRVAVMAIKPEKK